MVEELMITKGMELALDILKRLGGQAYAIEILEYLDVNIPNRNILKTSYDVNAALAALASKGLVTKKNEIFKGKNNTKYITDMDLIYSKKEYNGLIIIKVIG